MNKLFKVAIAAFVFLSANVAFAQMEKTVEVGGAETGWNLQFHFGILTIPMAFRM